MKQCKKYFVGIIILLIIVGLVIFSNSALYSRLLGNVNSIKAQTSESVKNGLVLDTDKVYSSGDTLHLNIYNGTKKRVAILSTIIKNGYCNQDEDCEFIENEMQAQTLNNDEEMDAAFSSINLSNSDLNLVGIKYLIDNEEYYLYTYVINLEAFNIGTVTIDTEGINDLQTAYEQSLSKINKKESEVKEESWLGYAALLMNAKAILSADTDSYYKIINLGEEKVLTNITTEEVTTITTQLTENSVAPQQSANYTEYNELIAEIEALDSNDFDSEEYAKFDAVYSLKNSYLNLTEEYQSKLDNYVSKLDLALSELLESADDADYSVLNDTLSTVRDLENKTADGKHKMYTDASWNNLQTAIANVKYGLKIYDQDIVDGYVTSINNAVAALAYAQADYSEVNRLINIYRDNPAYDNDWYTTSSKEAIDNYIATINFNYTVDNQTTVDDYANYLEPLVNGLELKDAKGYVSSDDYHPFEGALSLQEYRMLIQNLNENNYTASGVKKLRDIIDELTNDENVMYDYIYGFKINEQNEFDELLARLHDTVYGNYLEKKNGDYTELCHYYTTALGLNLDLYEDTSDLQRAIWNLNWDYKIDEQDSIDAETEALKQAIDALVMKKADYTEYDELLDMLLGLNPGNYADFSRMNYVIQLALSFRDAAADQQDRVDEIRLLMMDALKELVLKDADYDELKDVIEQLPNDTSKYPADVQEKINSYLEDVKKLPSDLKITDQEEIDELIKRGKELLEIIKAVTPENTDGSSATGNTPKGTNNTDKGKQNPKLIKAITINGKEVDLSKTPYVVVVGNDVTTADIKIDLAQAGSTYEIFGGSVLFEGDNELTIVVTTKDNEKYSYTLIIRKEAAQKNLNKSGVETKKESGFSAGAFMLFTIILLILILLIIIVIRIIYKNTADDDDSSEDNLKNYKE